MARQAAARSDRGTIAQGEVLRRDGAARSRRLRLVECVSHGQDFATVAGPPYRGGSRRIHRTYRTNSAAPRRNGGRRADHAGEGSGHPLPRRQEVVFSTLSDLSFIGSEISSSGLKPVVSDLSVGAKAPTPDEIANR